MKFLFSFLLILLSISAQAQKIRFTDSTNQWSTLSINGDGCSFSNTFLYGNDTIVHGLTYRSLYSTSSGYFGYHDLCFCGVVEFGTTFNYLIREDTLAGEVYYISTDTLEHTLYNYNLNVGDSITYPGFTDSVVSIDSTLINGVYHKIFNMQNKVLGFQRSYTVLEGVGCTNDPLFPAYFGGCFEYGESLLCFYENGINPAAIAPINSCSQYGGCGSYDYGVFNNASGCGNLSTSNIKQQPFSITINPNPAFDLLNINNINTQTIYSLFNIVGSVVQQGVLKEGNNSISVQALAPGMYMLELTDNAGEKKVRKIVKE